jgi:predicted component of type VI protein secretion system
MDGAAAIEFVKAHGVVLVAANGPVPKLTEAIAGEPIKGSWWGHPKGPAIYAALQVVTNDEDVLVCRAVNGKVTLVHRRLWPALIAAAELIPTERLARVEQEHTASGRHVNHETPFPSWAGAEELASARTIDRSEAVRQLGTWVLETPRPSRGAKGAPTS